MEKKQVKNKEAEKVLEKSVEVMEKDLKNYDKIKELKCDYEIFKTEREKAKMYVSEKCEICQKNFKKKDNIYVAWGKELKEIFICKKCAVNKQ
jgi:hypothetical protein